MAKTYRPYVPEQALLPPSLREWLPEDHLAYFVSDLIDQLDLSAISTVYEDEERGYPPYHPVMLTRVQAKPLFRLANDNAMTAERFPPVQNSADPISPQRYDY
jgi:hypothetical protein